MTVEDKQELVRLLHLYMADIIIDNKLNIESARFGLKENYTGGLKAQYEHARIIAAKLSVDVNNAIKTYWEL